MTKPSELRELTDDDARRPARRSEAGAVQAAVSELATGQLDSTTEITNYKREIARIHTLLREREIAAHESDRQEALMADDNARTTTNEKRANARKVREGIAVSTKMDKTVVVAVVDRVRHRRYQKTMQRTKRLYAHDETNDVREGDRVRVAETRRLSKLKRWRIVEVLERAR